MPHELTRWCSGGVSLGLASSAAGWDVARLVIAQCSAVLYQVHRNGHHILQPSFGSVSPGLVHLHHLLFPLLTTGHEFPSWSKELQEEVQKLNCKTYWALKRDPQETAVQGHGSRADELWMKMMP